ncbi:MAG: S8 family serine peptidase [Bacteroidia bacterium]
MSLQFTHIFGPVLFTIAFLVFGRGIIARSMGRRFRPLPAFILFLIALAYRFIVSKETLVEAYSFVHVDSNGFDMLLDRLTLVLMDFGIAMVVDAGYLAYKKQQAKLFWVPGAIALVISLIIYLLAAVIDRVADGIRSPDASEQAALLVELGSDDHIKELKPILHRYNASYARAFTGIDPTIDAQLDGADTRNLSQYYAIYVDEAFVNPLTKELGADRENVDMVQNNSEITISDPLPASQIPTADKSFLANDPQLSKQWYANSLDYNAVHQLLKNLSPQRKAKVAILDTGIDSNHEDLKSIFDSGDGKKDGHGHGTHCAGLAGAATNNGRGIASLNWEGRFISLLGYPALNKDGVGTDQTIAQAIINAANAGADVISMSLGSPGPTPKAQRQAIQYAIKKGAIVVVSAGNSNRDAKDFSPAGMRGVITVSAVDQFLNKAGFSNTNMSLHMPLAAPGVDIISAYPDGKYELKSGTSMATPIVAGILGIMRSFKPNITTKEAYQILQGTGKTLNDSKKVGKLVQPYPALEILINQNPL